MGDKSLRKKNQILEAAREVFFKRGYRAVTMKDIVEACGISRGGLYLYFANTKELFEEVLDREYRTLQSVLDAPASKNANPGEILLMYLDEPLHLQKLHVSISKKERTSRVRDLTRVNYWLRDLKQLRLL